MIRCPARALALGFVVLCLPPSLAAQDGVTLTAEEWRADLREMVQHVRETHREPFHTVTEEEFNAAVSALEKRLAELEPVEIVTEFARILAMVGDGHTRLTLPVNPDNLGYRQGHTPDPDPLDGVPRFHTLPVRFADFEEGIHVASATRRHADLIGARVLSIGGLPVEEAITGLAPFTAHDSPAGLRFQSIINASIPELLHAAGAEASPTVTEIGVEGEDGRRTVALAGVRYDESPPWVFPPGQSAPEQEPRYFEMERIGEDVLLIRINQINDSEEEALGEFSRRVALELEDTDPERVILDLRRCHGGDQSISRALVLPFVRWEKSTRPGHLFALVGPETFSAAVNLAGRLEEWTQITFVGEPLGSGPSHYSSSDREALDNSGLVARVSTGYFVGWTGSEWRESVDIGVPQKARVGDYLAGDDTVLEAALASSTSGDVTTDLITTYEAGGINAALISWARYRTDPATAHLGLERVGNEFARYFLDAGELRFAAALFLFNREFYPNSADAWLGEAEAHLAAGNREQALDVIEQAIERFPDDPRFVELRSREPGGVVSG